MYSLPPITLGLSSLGVCLSSASVNASNLLFITQSCPQSCPFHSFCPLFQEIRPAVILLPQATISPRNLPSRGTDFVRIQPPIMNFTLSLLTGNRVGWVNYRIFSCLFHLLLGFRNLKNNSTDFGSSWGIKIIEYTCTWQCTDRVAVAFVYSTLLLKA